MEFWGVEVKAGEPLKVQPDFGMVVHLSQACLGETKSKGNEAVYLNLKVDDKKFVIGNLSLDKNPQMQFDLVFEKDFELSHNWKHGSIYFCGYQTAYGEQDDEFSGDDDSEEEEELDVAKIQEALAKENGLLPLLGKPAQKAVIANAGAAKSNAAKPESSQKPKVKVVEPSKDDEDDDDSDEDDSDDDDEGSEDDSDEDMLDGSDDEEDSEDEEETPKKVEQSKKRSNDSAIKTPASNKKAKVASPKSDGKKGVHVATPHPAKKGGKTPGTDKKPQHTPKSAGSVSCNSCKKSFNSDKALESHNKAKHA